MKPLITIITITYNSEKYFQNTIDSVANQTYPFIEYIIIDGQSTDSTLSIIHQNKDKITKWTSEKDNGIADAMNKGLKSMAGDYVLFLHSDDYLINDESIEEAVRSLDNHHNIFAFSIFFQTGKDTKQKKIPSWGLGYNLKTKLLHQGVLCRKELFKEIGGFDTQFKIAMDYDFFLRAYRNNCSTKLIKNKTLSVMRDTGVSSKLDWPSLSARLQEEKRVHFKNAKYFMMPVYYMYWLLYPFYKRVVSH